MQAPLVAEVLEAASTFSAQQPPSAAHAVQKNQINMMASTAMSGEQTGGGPCGHSQETAPQKARAKPTLPEDVLCNIYRWYFKLHVLPALTQHPRVSFQQSPLIAWHGHLEAALSRASMYSRGALDVSVLSPSDRAAILDELESRSINAQVHAISGKLIVRSDANIIMHKHDEPAFGCPAIMRLDKDRYVVVYHNHWRDPADPRVHRIQLEPHEVCAGYSTFA